MSAPSFTPGPWFAADGGVIWHETIVGASHPECCGDFKPNGECCGLSVQGYHEELAQEQIASCSPNDANLIAAAPDGYAIAERLVTHLRDDFRIPDNADEGWVVDSLGHALGGIYLDALAYLAKARGDQ